MSDHVLQTLELVKGDVRKLQSQLAEKMRMGNSLCEMAGIPPLYANTEPEEHAAAVAARGDEYYGQAMSTALRMILDARQKTTGPATVNELHEALKAGGYKFDAANESNEKKSLRICLTKNSSIFHKLPTGKFGLAKWYPKIRAAKKAGAEIEAEDEGGDEDETGRETMAAEFGENGAAAKAESNGKKEVKLIESK